MFVKWKDDGELVRILTFDNCSQLFEVRVQRYLASQSLFMFVFRTDQNINACSFILYTHCSLECNFPRVARRVFFCFVQLPSNYLTALMLSLDQGGPYFVACFHSNFWLAVLVNIIIPRCSSYVCTLDYTIKCRETLLFGVCGIEVFQSKVIDLLWNSVRPLLGQGDSHKQLSDCLNTIF